MKWKKILPSELNRNPFQMIGKDWMLITAKKDGKVNTMTASWGGVGVLWGKEVAFVVIRPQRYTKEFIDASEEFSLTFLGEEYKKQLGYLGSVSGREENKIEKSGLTIAYENGVPYFSEANQVFLCKKLFMQPLEEQSFLEPGLIEQWYKEKDFHILYVAQILEIMTQ